MSELTAWLADLSLEHVEETLIDAGITRVDEIGAMDAESLATIGIEADAISTLFTALGRVSQVATPLPAPPQLPAAVAAAAAQQQQQQPAADAPTPPPLVWRRSVEGVWEEHAGQHDDAAAGHSEWEAIDTPDGHVYYYHAATGETLWEHPATITTEKMLEIEEKEKEVGPYVPIDEEKGKATEFDQTKQGYVELIEELDGRFGPDHERALAARLNLANLLKGHGELDGGGADIARGQEVVFVEQRRRLVPPRAPALFPRRGVGVGGAVGAHGQLAEHGKYRAGSGIRPPLRYLLGESAAITKQG